ncbi:MAG: hypothetical protein ACREEW_06365 [Caulobacteraceae bacterium]
MRNQVGAMSRKVARNALASFFVLCCTTVTACNGRPERTACIDQSVSTRLTEMMYEQAGIDADILSEKGNITQLTEVQNQLQLLKRQSVIHLSNTSMQSYDAVTGKVTCESMVNYVFPNSDRSDAERQEVGRLSPRWLNVDINSDDPRSMVTYSISPMARGGGNIVEAPTMGQPSVVLLIVAAARVQLAKGSY